MTPETPPSSDGQPADAPPLEPPKPLRFKVAPHVVEDLGINLYTSLPRVLVEFVANAYDADSPMAEIRLDHEAIIAARTTIREAYKAEKVRADAEKYEIPSLESRTLPADLKIEIIDAGAGMSRSDLDKKFLIAGRRRRLEEKSPETPNGRLIMGRKGLGKLAGFGVAKQVEVITRKAGEPHATRICLRYDELQKARTTEDIEIKDEILADGGGFAKSGTRIVLSELLYDPAKSRKDTLLSELAEHFEFITAEDFVITMNSVPVPPLDREYAWGWPNPERAASLLVDDQMVTEEGKTIYFKYRMRFIKDSKGLPASKRGVRVYARKRLAAASSLLDADTNMHGFRMTDYLDGIVEADFLDAQKTDYIATDRQSLRWDSPFLSPLKEKLSDEIRTACNEYQKVRDEATKKIVEQDPFTSETIVKAELSAKDRKLAMRIASLLAATCKQGIADPIYRARFPEILRGIGHGTLLATIATLAKEDHPDFARVVSTIIELTADELDRFISVARARVTAIEALQKVVLDQNFKDKKQENIVQQLLEKAPWMIDSTLGQTITANETMNTLFDRLAQDLKIGAHAGTVDTSKEDRPDLVFLVGSAAGGRVLVVELKAANVPLVSEHLDQLEDYMGRVEEWLEANRKTTAFKVHGHLIGTRDLTSRARGVVSLNRRIKKAGPESDWTVRGFIDVLTDTQQTHRELIEAYAKGELKLES